MILYCGIVRFALLLYATFCYFLHRLEASAVINHLLKWFSKQHGSSDSDMGCLVATCSVRWSWHFCVNCRYTVASWRCETACRLAAAVQRPLVGLMAASCTDVWMSGSYCSSKTFSSVGLTLTVDLGLRFHKHNARLAMRETPTDTVMLEMPYQVQVVSIHQVALLQIVKWVNSHYRYVQYTLALRCAKIF